MVKHIQTICRLLTMNNLGVFDYFVGLALKKLTLAWNFAPNLSFIMKMRNEFQYNLIKVERIKIRSFFWSIFPVFGLNTGKYGPEKTLYLDTSLSDGETFQGKPIYEINEQQMLNFDKFHFDFKHVLCFCSPLFCS